MLIDGEGVAIITEPDLPPAPPSRWLPEPLGCRGLAVTSGEAHAGRWGGCFPGRRVVELLPYLILIDLQCNRSKRSKSQP